MTVQFGFLLAFLILESLIDLKARRISLVIAAFFAASGIFFIIRDADTAYRSWLTALIPGGTLFLFSYLTRGGIGAGDAVVLTVLGLYLELAELLPAFGLSLLISGLFAGIMLVTKKRKKTDAFPFVPFLLISVLLTKGIIS